MRNLALLAIASAILGVGADAAQAAVTCSARTPTAINTVAADSLKCQTTIAREGTKFISTKMKVLAACQLKNPAGSCPLTKDSDKILAAATKAAEKITKACSTDTVQAGLQSSYKLETDDTIISSCMLSQHNVIAGLVNANTTGVTTEAWPGTAKSRATCLKEVSKQGWQLVDKALKISNGCVASQMKQQIKDNVTGDLSAACVGSYDVGGVFVPAGDTKTGGKQTKLLTKVADKLAAKCSDAEAVDEISTLFGCAGSTTVADLEKCIVCNGMGSVMDALEQQYSERGAYVEHGAGALQDAADDLVGGEKLLIASGDYQEEVTLPSTANDVEFVGCGGATNNRPRIIPPVTEVSGRGIQGASINDLLFQSISVYNQQNDGIRIALANNVVYRDIVGDGNRRSRYAVFPVTSNNVTVELCTVRNVADAGIYIGQSSTVLARWNDVRGSVAGTEIENNGNAQVYGNYATGNTAGLLVFKDGSLPVQLSQCHEVHHNLFEAVNEPNYGTGTVGGVPRGTGILVISNDTSLFHHNIARNNDTFGMSIVTADLAGLPVPAEQAVESNYVYDNVFLNNGGNPDTAALPLPVQSDFTFLATSSSGNCQNSNVFVTTVGTAPLPACTLPPAAFPSCPAPTVP